MDANLTNVLIALAGLVGGYFTFKTANQKSMHEREQSASREWQNLYDTLKHQMEQDKEESISEMQSLRDEINNLRDEISTLKVSHSKEVHELKEQNKQLKEENRQLRTENATYKNKLISMEGKHYEQKP